MRMMVSLVHLTYYRTREELDGIVLVKYDETGKEESCVFRVSDSAFLLTGGGEPLPDWTNKEKQQMEERIGQLLARFKKDTFGYPSKITFVV